MDAVLAAEAASADLVCLRRHGGQVSDGLVHADDGRGEPAAGRQAHIAELGRASSLHHHVLWVDPVVASSAPGD